MTPEQTAEAVKYISELLKRVKAGEFESTFDLKVEAQAGFRNLK